MPTTAPSPAIEAQVEIGVLFATVKASVVFGTHVGAHVLLDGTAIADVGLWSIKADADEFDVTLAVRQAAALAVLRAAREIGATYEVADARHTASIISRALPMPVEI